MCEQVVCGHESKLCVDKLCEDKLCESKLCVDKLCVSKLCVGGGREEERRRRDTEPKTRTPHKDVGKKMTNAIGAGTFI